MRSIVKLCNIKTICGSPYSQPITTSFRNTSEKEATFRVSVYSQN
jgi:hypothetical protein